MMIPALKKYVSAVVLAAVLAIATDAPDAEASDYGVGEAVSGIAVAGGVILTAVVGTAVWYFFLRDDEPAAAEQSIASVPVVEDGSDAPGAMLQ